MHSSIRRAAFVAALMVTTLAASRPAAAAGPDVSGRLVDSSGEPVAGATVEIFPYPSGYDVRKAWAAGRRSEPTDSAKSDKKGAFSVRAKDAGLWVLTVRASSHAEVVVALVPLIRSRTLEDIELPAAKTLTVRVRDTAGEAIPDALVVVRPERAEGRQRLGRRTNDSTFPRTQAARTGADGSVRMTLPSGVLLHAAATARDHGFREIEHGGGKVLDIVLHKGKARSFFVRDTTGKRRPSALIVMGEQNVPVAETDASGETRVVVAPATELTAWSEDGLSGTLRIGKESSASDAPVPIVLAAALEIAGVVVDAASRDGIADAVVYSRTTTFAVTHTDARGNYLLRLPSSSRFVQAAKDGYSAGAERIEGDEGPTLALEAAGRLVGRVVDSAGEPVRDAEIRSLGPVSQRGHWRGGQAVARSDEQGRFELMPLPVDQAVIIQTRSKGFAPSEVDATVVTGQPAEPIEIVLSPGRVAIGTVVDADDQPLEGAMVTLVPAPPSGRPDRRFFGRLANRNPTEAVTDAEGRYRIEDLSAGRFDLAAERVGFARARVPGVSVPRDERVVDLGTLVLLEGATLEGLVVDPEGRPLAEATVTVREQGGGFASVIAYDNEPDATSGADGRFAVEDLQPGGTVGLEVSREGYAKKSLASIRVPTEEPLRVELVPGTDLEGVVVDPRGGPIGSAMVEARPDGQRFGAEHHATNSDGEGHFTIETLAPGSWTLTVSAKGFQKAEKAGVKIETGSVPESVRIQLERGGTVVGVVTGRNGEPIVGVRVNLAEQGKQRLFSFNRSLASTDGDGTYRLDGLPSGRHVLSFEHARHRKAVRDVEIGLGELRLDVTLEAGLEIAGAVVDSAGSPVAGAQVLAQPAVMNVVNRIMVGMNGGEETDAEGAFRLSGLDAGSYTLTATKSGYASARSEMPIELTASSIEGIELRLGSGGTVVGRVLGIAFDDLARLQLIVMGTDMQAGTRPLIASVDHDGSFRVENVAAGSWMVYAGLGQERFRREIITMPEGGGEVSVELDFGGGYTLSGTVRMGTAPATGVQVVARGLETGGVAQATTDPQGGYRFEGLEPGRYSVLVMRQLGLGRTLAEREVEVHADKVFDITLQEIRVSGRVVDTGGLPVAGASVSLTATDNATSSLFQGLLGGGARTGDDGRFELAHVQPGSFRLQVTHDDFAAASKPLEIDEAVPIGELEVVLERTTGLEILAVLPSGQPARSLIVAVLDAQGNLLDSGSFTGGEAGVVRLTRTPTGTFTLLVRGQATATTEVTVTVPGPRAQVALQPAGTLHVRVPAAGAVGKLDLTLSRNGRPERILGAFGQLTERWDLFTAETTLSPLASGLVTLRVVLPDGTELTAQAVVIAGQQVEVEIR